jgi:hypothetical protein
MCDVGNPGPGLMQAQQCGRVKPVNGIPTLRGQVQAPTLDNWISNGNTDIKVHVLLLISLFVNYTCM